MTPSGDKPMLGADNGPPKVVESPFELWEETRDLRFSLRELFIATTVVAKLLALLRTLGLFGAVAAFLMALVLSFLVYPSRVENTRAARRREQQVFALIWT